jgi:predicted DNA-binding transcriptional regulator YafY
LATYVTQSGVNARCLIAERLPPSMGLVEPIDERSCFYETGSSSYESLAMHVSLIGADFEIIEPVELVEEIRRLAERYRRAAG